MFCVTFLMQVSLTKFFPCRAVRLYFVKFPLHMCYHTNGGKVSSCTVER